MNQVLVSTAARTDLKNIAVYTQKVWGIEQRRSYLKELDTSFELLAENPSSGITCDYIISGLRKHSHKSHVIFYEIRNSGIFIIRVLHKSMDVEQQLCRSN